MLIAGWRDKLNSFAIASSSGFIGPWCRRKKWSAIASGFGFEVATGARGCRSIQGNRGRRPRVFAGAFWCARRFSDGIASTWRWSRFLHHASDKSQAWFTRCARLALVAVLYVVTVAPSCPDGNRYRRSIKSCDVDTCGGLKCCALSLRCCILRWD
jgi:hypothetical protein